MALITEKSRYKEFGFVFNYEYELGKRMEDSAPARETVTALLRPTSMVSAIELISHTIKQGEDLHRLALKYYGDAKLWWFIADFNPLLSENDLKVGDQVLIPSNRQVNAY
jgi:nucleoid-associated protein YgaU